MYLLGVDGGSTKLDFAVSDLDGKILFEYRIYEPSNLKYVGADNVIANLKSGLEKVNLAGFETHKIVSSYFGIAECGVHSYINGRVAILEFLENFGLKKFVLADDQYSVFRSLSVSEYGVLANAGTGSNINLFAKEGDKTYKSLGHGGRDFGKAILAEIKYGGFGFNSEVHKIVSEFLGISPIDFYDKLSASEFIINKQITQISRILFEEYNTNEKLQKELDMLLISIADRWGSKIAAYCWANFGLGEFSSFDLVLTGSMWNWERIFEISQAEIKKVFKNVNIIKDNNIKPVLGCIKLAKENL